jgi:hypothetical protein
LDIDREVAWVRRRRTAGKVVPEVRLRALCEAWIEMFLRQAMVEFDDFFGALEVHSTRSEILVAADAAEGPQGTSALHLAEASFVHAAAGDIAQRVTACGVTLWGEPAARGRWQTDPSRRCPACAVHAASYGVLEEDPRWSAIMPGTHAPLAVAFGAGLLVGALDEAPLTISHKDLHASALHATYEAMAEEVATIMRELGEPWIRARLGDRYDQALATNRRRAVAPPFAARLTATDVAWMLETHAEHAGERQPSDALYRAVIGGRHGGLSPTTTLMIDVAYSQVHAALTRAIGELRTGGSGAPVVGFLPTHLAGRYTSDFLELFADVCQTAHQKLVALPAGGRVNSTAEELAAFAILDSVAHAVDVHALSCETTGEIPLAGWEKRDVLDDIAELLSSDTAYFFDDDARLLFRPPRDFDDRSGEEQLSQTSLHVSRWFEPFRPHETTDPPANDTH